MKKLTVLNLYKLDSEELNYAVVADLQDKRKGNSIALFLSDKYQFNICIRNNMPIVAALNNDTGEWVLVIEFFKRENNQFFGKSYYNGKCIYGLYSHPWHKKVKQAQFTLFESEVDFDDLYHFDFHDGKYVPEFSTKQNWMQTFDLQSPENLTRSLYYALSQPETPEFKMLINAMREKGLITE